MQLPDVGAKYRHFKSGHEYLVLNIATHSEILEKMVVYQALYHSAEYGDNAIWVRPAAMFLEMVSHNGKQVSRFTRI